MREKLYSVEMTETELRLFSEFLEQREYARGNVSGMNPNIIRRRVVNGKTITKTAPGKGKSAKQIRESQSRSIVDRSRPQTKYTSDGFRTVESPESISKRKEWDSKYDQRLRNQKQRERADLSSVEMSRSTGHIFADPKREGIHEVIASKEGLIKGLKENGSKNPDQLHLRWHKGRHIPANVPSDHSANLSVAKRADGSPVKLRDFYVS